MNLRMSMMGVLGVAGLGVLGSVLMARAQPPGSEWTPIGAPKDPAPKVVKKPGFAVVELFTSEGCSSCPPADALAAKVSREARERGDDVYVIALHVDYWNHLGWTDPFAQGQFTKRQRAYAGALGKAGGNGGVFTPEMVVNGAVGFTGSDADAAARELERALATGGRLKVEATLGERKAGEAVRVRAHVKGDSRWTVLSAAVVEDGLASEVKSGENAGKSLMHDRVARAFAQTPVKDDDARVEMTLPAGVREANCHVVVFVQDDKSLRVLAATELPLEPAKPATSIPSEGAKSAPASPAKPQTPHE